MPHITARDMRELPGWMHNGLFFRIFDAQSRPDGVDYMYNTNRVAQVTDIGTEQPLEAGQAYGVRLGEYHTTSWVKDSLTLMTATHHPGEPNFTLGKLVADYPNDAVDSHYVQRHILSPEDTALVAGRIAVRLRLDG